MKESKLFSNRTEFKKKSGNAYDSARKNKWLDEMVWLENDNGKHPKNYLENKHNIMQEAKKYKTKEEFQKRILVPFLPPTDMDT